MTTWTLPPLGGNPSSSEAGTTPGSFANPPEIGGPRAFSSPDTPGMPQPSDKTAWDFLPSGWRRDDATGFAVAPEGFEPVTQLEHARLGTVTPEMQRVAEREPHLTPEQVRDEIAAGRIDHPGKRPPPDAQEPRPDGHRARDQNQGQRQHGRQSPSRRATRTKRSRSCKLGRAAGAATP